jgi:hypothetical protein
MTNAYAESLGPDFRRGDRIYKGTHSNDTLAAIVLLIMAVLDTAIYFAAERRCPHQVRAR